jgi:hypothetical protein
VNSSTPAHRTRGAKPRLRWLGLAALLLSLALPAAARDFDVTEASTRLEKDTYLLNATVRYDFSDRALEALDNGVPLTVEVHVQVRPENDWVWTKSLSDQRLRYRIRYKPLSERYLVSRLPGQDGRTYVTRDAALAALGELNDLALVSRRQLQPETAYDVHIRVSLDIEELPLPLRPIAYLYPSWKQSSKWTRWPLTP